MKPITLSSRFEAPIEVTNEEARKVWNKFIKYYNIEVPTNDKEITKFVETNANEMIDFDSVVLRIVRTNSKEHVDDPYDVVETKYDINDDDSKTLRCKFSYNEFAMSILNMFISPRFADYDWKITLENCRCRLDFDAMGIKMIECIVIQYLRELRYRDSF